MYKRYLNIEPESKQSIFLLGARKSGKSTYLKEMSPISVRYDLLNTDLRMKYLVAPHLLRQDILAMSPEELEHPIIIDEIQKIPDLLDEVHWLIENSPAFFVLCGSSARSLKRRGVNLLGGRAIKYHFYPLVYPEIKQDFDLLRIFNNGLLPSHFLSNDPRRLLKSYINDYLAQEIQAEGLVRNLASFAKFIASLAFTNGEMLNYTNISRDCGVDAKTVKEYYNILVDTLVGYLIDPYNKNPGREIISSIPKFYLFDVGIAGRIAGRSLSEASGAEAGKALEHYVLTELKAYIDLNDLDHQIHYWRTKTGLEVDFIIAERNNKPVAVEVKISSNVHDSEMKALKVFMQEYDLDKVYLVCLEARQRIVRTAYGDIHLLPLREFLEKLWSGDIVI